MVYAMFNRGWRAALLGGCALTVLWGAVPALAADAVPAAASAERSFHIAAQSLGAALTQLGQQAGVQLSVDPALVAGRSTTGLSGNMSTLAALARLLDGTGLTFRFTDANTVVLQRIAAGGDAVLLNPVTVESTAGARVVETGDGPVAGYVAKRTTGATKTDASLLETPQAVSVVTRDQMEAQDVQRLNEVLRYTAGVVPETRGAVATRYDMYTIRGFDADTYWNGLKLAGNGWYILPQLDPYFMERVDVMKGTSSALYGQAKAGGIVNETGKAPTATAQHEVGFEFGTDAHMRATVDMSGPVDGNNRVLYRVVGVGLSEDGQQDTTESERVGVMPSFTLLPGDDTKITLYGLYQHDPKAGTYGSVPAKGSVYAAPRGYISTDFYDGDSAYEQFDRTQMALGYQTDAGLAKGLRLRANGRWFHTDQKYASIYGSGEVSDDGTETRAFIRSDDAADTFAFDNQLEAKLGTGAVSHTLVGGLDYQRLRSTYRTNYGSASSINVYSPTYGNAVVDEYDMTKTSVSSNQLGVYAQDQAQWNRATLTLSGRQDWAQGKTLTTGESQFDRAFTGRAGLTYLLDGGVAPYVAYSQSFVPQVGINALTGQSLKPEEGEQYELGVKYQPEGMNALFSAAVFDLTRSNLMTWVSGLGYVQSGEARSRGLELEAKAEITPDLSVVASYTYLDTKYERDDTGLTGKRLTGIPRNMASVWADYKLPGSLRGLSLGAGVRYFDDSTNSANTFAVGGATLVDASVHYDLAEVNPNLVGADVYVNAKNLFDERYATCFYGDASGSSNWCSYGFSRTVVAGLRYRW